MKELFYKVKRADGLYRRGNGRGLYAWPQIDASKNLSMVAVFDTLERAQKKAVEFVGTVEPYQAETIPVYL